MRSEYHGRCARDKNDSPFSQRARSGHSVAMRLLNLHLRQALVYATGMPHDLDSLLTRIREASDGQEFLLAWDTNTVVENSPDGPVLKRPMPPPVFAGSIVQQAQGQGLSAVSVSTHREELTQSLEAGLYAFTQTRAQNAQEAVDALEWLIRESWWSGAKTCGLLYLRLVAEDGKVAVQPMMKQEEAR